jgi:hypothetical protein
MKKKDDTIGKLNVADGAASMPFSVLLLEDREIDELVLLEISKPDNGAYLMKIKQTGVGNRTDSSLETTDMNAEELFEAWMVMGHTIKHLVGDYKKELIEYMVKEYRTRQQEEDNV